MSGSPRNNDDQQRAFYRRLLELGAQSEIEPLLDQALALIVDVTGAVTDHQLGVILLPTAPDGADVDGVWP